MPSLSILKRSGRDSNPWSLRPQTQGEGGGSPHEEHGHQHADDNPSHQDSHDLGSNCTNGTDTTAQTAPLPPSSPSSSSPTSPAATKRERRDSKRELLGFISRSIRRPNRAATTNTSAGPSSPDPGHDSMSTAYPAIPPTSQPSSQPSRPNNKLQKTQRQNSNQALKDSQREQQTRSQIQDHDQAQRQPQKLQPSPPITRNHRRGKSSVTTAATAATGLTAFSATTSNTQDSFIQARRDPDTTPLLSSPSRSGLVVNTNKPLPSPPLPGSELDQDPPAKPVLKLNRIMASLSDDDIEKLFSGAPQYFARSEGHFTGAPHPSVAYPWDESLQIRDLTDHVQIEDKAWGVVTAWPHITRRPGSSSNSNTISNNNTTTSNAQKAADPSLEETPAFMKRGHFFPRCRERPSMLSMQGLEKGTIGYEAALELSVSDALQEDQFGFDTLGTRPKAITDARRSLMDPQVVAAANAVVHALALETGKTDRPSSDEDTSSGVNAVGESQILEELIKNGQRYADGSFYDEKQSKEFYDELFHHILRPPKRKAALPRSSISGSGHGNDPVRSLTSQIEALLDVLTTPNVWIDFSHVEWRLRLGQILWTSTPNDDFDDGVRYSQDDQAATVGERYTERYWLLLQILLSTELLLRLDAITDGDEIGLEFVHPTLVHRFEKEANQAVRWSLILARAWLENIDVIRLEDHESESKMGSEPDSPLRKQTSNHSIPGKGGKHRDKHTIGWISTLTKKLSMVDSHGRQVASHKNHVYVMKAKHAPRQQYGLFHFAQELRWPDETPDRLPKDGLDEKERLNSKILNSTTAAGHSPRSSLSKTRLDFNRQLPRRRKVVAGLHTGGWLSKTYLSGLMLPGDSLCNLLMATLLEGDEAALKTLGPIAHLGSGFVYRGMSFWSTACIVGRVLGAGAGASDCMSWVSSDVVPTGAVGEGWINVDVDDVRDDVRQTNRRARIWGKAAIERESYVLGDAEPENVLPADFVIPYEAVYKEKPPSHTRVDLQRFELYTPYERKQRANKLKEQVAQKEDATPKDKVGNNESQATKSFFAEVAFAVSSDGAPEEIFTYDLSYDIYFVTAHPCVAPSRVKVVKSPTSPTIQQIDVTGTGLAGRATSMHVTGHPLHKYFTYASIHLSSLIRSRDKTLEQLLAEHAASINRTVGHKLGDVKPARVLVIDCITGFSPQPSASEMPLSPVVDGPRPSIDSSISSLPPLTKEISPIASLSTPILTQPLVPVAQGATTATSTTSKVLALNTSTSSPRPTTATGQSAMHHETRRRRFGSDMEILVRAICAEKGWNAVVSRRRRGCLSCAIREAGALGWKVVIRVD